MAMRKKIIPSLLLAALLAGGAHAEAVSDSLRTTVYFRMASSRLELPYMDNAAHLETLTKSIRNVGADSTVVLRCIRILSSASPEGNTKFNKDLSERRGKELLGYLKQSLSLPDSVFVLQPVGEDWDGLAELVGKTDAPWRSKALEIINDTPEWIVSDGKVVDGRKRQLMRLEGGRTWQYMKDNFFSKLRGGVLVVCMVERVERNPEYVQPEKETDADALNDSTVDAMPEQPEAGVAETERSLLPGSEGGRNCYWAVKTNLLYDAALVPNVGLEFYLGKGWSIGGNWMYAWWKTDTKHRYWRVYGGELDVRKYFGRKAAEKPLQGHHLGVYAQGLTYDFETGGRGYLSDFAYGVGIEYGYSLPVAKRLNLDFGIGIGYSGGKYKVYDPEDGCYVYKETRQRRWFGPTKAEISLVWLLGHGNVNSKKGGTK